MVDTAGNNAGSDGLASRAPTTDAQPRSTVEGPSEDLVGAQSEAPSSRQLALERRLENIERALAELRRHVEERLLYDAAKEEAFGRLYADLDAEKKHRSGEAMKPILRDLVRLYDCVNEAEREGGNVQQSLSVIREGLLEVLSRAEVERMETITDRYDRTRQAACRVEPTERAEDDWTVAAVVRDGFMFRGGVLRPQQVVVRRLREEARA